MKNIAIAAFAATLSGVASLCAATNEQAVAMLDDVVVYASRTGALKENIPGAVQIITRDEIESSGSRDFADLLRKNSGLDMRALNGNPLMNSVYMRGFGENGFGRVKILFDGEELNNIDMAAPDLFSIPLWDIDRVEILHGPSPVLYGDGAVAGVVNVLSSMQDYSRKTRILARAGSYDTYGVNFSTRGGFEEEGILYRASYDYLKSGGYRDRSAYNINTANAGLRKNFENGSTIGLCVNYTDAFYEMPGALGSDWKHSRKTANDKENWARLWKYGISLDSKMHLADDQWLYIDGGFGHRFSKSHWVSWGITDIEQETYSYNFSPRYVNEMDILDHANKFTFGFDFRQDEYGYASRNRIANTTDKSRFHRSRYALFAHDAFDLTEKLSIVAGTRLERINNYWNNAAQPLAKSHRHDLTGDFELGLVYRPVENAKTYVKATKFHRSPFCDERNYNIGSYMLRPEKGYSLDTGVEWNFMEEFTFDFDAYAMKMEDEIFYNPNIFANVNSPAKTERVGFDTGISYLHEKTAEASIRYSAVRSEFTSGQYNDCAVPLVPKNRVRAEAGVWIIDDLEIKGGYTFVGSQRMASDFLNTEEKLKSYSLFDIGAYYTPHWAEGWKASFVIDNLLDRKYCDFAVYSAWGNSYYPACGRSFMFTLSYEF